MLKKIVIIGPESTGKSTLGQQLAEHYESLYCPEYAREYLLANGRDYNYQDLLNIAKGQIALEDEHTSKLEDRAAPLLENDGDIPLFIDTDMYVMKVWSEFVFNNCHSYILEEIAKRKYDMYLLCEPDLPWIKDELREYPDHATRIKLFNIYRDLMQNQSVPWGIVRGQDQERLNRAIQLVDPIVVSAEEFQIR
jgi:NadR type nicotinamide-nucleotide adenylyltransferase